MKFKLVFKTPDVADGLLVQLRHRFMEEACEEEDEIEIIEEMVDEQLQSS